MALRKRSQGCAQRSYFVDRVTIPEGDFSRLWDLQGWSGVAVRTEVSAQAGTADVTPLLWANGNLWCIPR
ncbi:MAG: hypothetical protein KAI06_08445 [Anaerolineales bacterium]|nr:hypothetical protein [Anaerolineales bacterium]